MPEAQWLPHWDTYRQEELTEEEHDRVRAAIFSAAWLNVEKSVDGVTVEDSIMSLDREMTALGIEGSSKNKRTPPEGMNVAEIMTERWVLYDNTPNGEQTDGT